MSYYLLNDNFFYDNVKLFHISRSYGFVYSSLKIEDKNNDSLLKCKISPWLGLRSLKIIEQKFTGKISFSKKDKLYYLNLLLKDKSFEITIVPTGSYFSLKLQGDFIVNNKKVGVLFGKIEGLNTKYYFEFTEGNSELIYYCLVYFAMRYYDIDDVA